MGDLCNLREQWTTEITTFSNLSKGHNHWSPLIPKRQCESAVSKLCNRHCEECNKGVHHHLCLWAVSQPSPAPPAEPPCQQISLSCIHFKLLFFTWSWAREATFELSKRGISVSYITLGPLDSVLLVFQAIQGIHLSNIDPRAGSVPNVKHQSLLSLGKKHLSGTPLPIVCFHTRGGVFARWCLPLFYPS